MPSIKLEVDLIGQPNEQSCWITAAEMVYQYFEQKNHPHINAVRQVQNNPFLHNELNQLFLGGQGLIPPNIVSFCQFYGFKRVPDSPSGIWTVEMVVKLLSQYGPFFCGLVYPGGRKHAVTITGADTTSTPELVYYNDPLPVDTGSKKSFEGNEFPSKMVTRLGSVALVFTNKEPLAPLDYKKMPRMVLTKFT